MEASRAHALVNSILDTHISAVRGKDSAEALIQALENARQDLQLMVEQVIDECCNSRDVNVETALDEAEEITRGAR